MEWVKATISLIFLAYLLKSIYLYLSSHGVAMYHNNVHPGKCRIVPNISCGSEQISVTNDGLAFITNGHKGLTRCNPKYTPGNLFTFDFNNPEQDPVKLQIISSTIQPLTFDPHGMDIIEDSVKGIVHVYVVNHPKDRDTIEVFVYNKTKPSEIVHFKTIGDEKFVCLNDISMIDESTFYVTNFGKYCRLGETMAWAELVLKLKTGNIIYYNYGETKNVVDALSFNGITLSKDRKQVVSVEMGAREIHFYDRNGDSNGHLTLSNKAYLGYVPDNVFVDKQTGHYYVAYFKDILSFHAVAANKTAYCSVGAAMVTVSKDGDRDVFDVKEVLYDRGESFLSMGSSFVHYKGHYLIGTVFDGLGYCRKEECTIG